jgi:hypothetical protein
MLAEESLKAPGNLSDCVNDRIRRSASSPNEERRKRDMGNYTMEYMEINVNIWKST